MDVNDGSAILRSFLCDLRVSGFGVENANPRIAEVAENGHGVG